MKTPIHLPLILLLALLLRAPGWFTADEKSRSQLFSPDEFQHIQVAASFIDRWAPKATADWDDQGAAMYTARGYGIQIGVIGLLLHQVGGMKVNVENLILIGRVLSTLYALLLIGLVYGIGLHLFHSRFAAVLGALLMALFDLGVTFSHYAVPATAYAGWTYASVFLIILFREHFRNKKPDGEPGWALSLAIPLTTAAVFSMTFDFLPIVLAAVVLLLLWLRKKRTLRSTVGYAGSFFAFFVLFFYLLTLFDFGWLEVRQAFTTLFRENYQVIAADSHWWANPLVYLMSLTNGTGILVMVVFFIALFSLLGRGVAFPGQQALRWWLFFLAMEGLVLWNLDAPLVRRTLVFLPFVAIVAGRGLAGVLRGDPNRPVWQRNGATALVVVYTLALTLISQVNTWLDPRKAAVSYLSQYGSEAPVHFSPNAWAPGMPQHAAQEEAQLLVLEEAFYSRYWKSFTTPFKYPPACCEQVYRCRSQEECRWYQELLAGRNPQFRLAALYPTREWLPERRLFKQLFGSYDAFVGDVRIYERVK